LTHISDFLTIVVPLLALLGYLMLWILGSSWLFTHHCATNASLLPMAAVTATAWVYIQAIPWKLPLHMFETTVGVHGILAGIWSLPYLLGIGAHRHVLPFIAPPIVAPNRTRETPNLLTSWRLVRFHSIGTFRPP
jgi:hypothetical protein